MTTQYPILDIKHFTYNKETNFFKAKYRNLPHDPVPYGEFLMRNPKTGNEVIFLLISNIYDLDERTCGWRFIPSYDDVARFPGLADSFVDILLD